MLEERRDDMERLVEALIEREVLSDIEIEAMVGKRVGTSRRAGDRHRSAAQPVRLPDVLTSAAGRYPPTSTPNREPLPPMPSEWSVVSAGVVVADHLCTPIDHLPAAGELVKADELILSIGGGACNAAMDLARLGVRSRICGRVGNDVFGRFVAETLQAQNVDCNTLRIDPQHATSQTLIVNVKGQDRRFIHSFGATRASPSPTSTPPSTRPPASSTSATS